MITGERGIKKSTPFGAPSDLSIRRPCENLGSFCNLRTRSSYSVNTAVMLCTIFSTINIGIDVDVCGFAHPRCMYDHFPAITASWYTQWREVVKRRRHEETEWKRNTDNRKPEVRYRSDTSVGERKVAVLILQWVPVKYVFVLC